MDRGTRDTVPASIWIEDSIQNKRTIRTPSNYLQKKEVAECPLGSGMINIASIRQELWFDFNAFVDRITAEIPGLSRYGLSG